jgi:hypothetical protein
LIIQSQAGLRKLVDVMALSLDSLEGAPVAFSALDLMTLESVEPKRERQATGADWYWGKTDQGPGLNRPGPWNLQGRYPPW